MIASVLTFIYTLYDHMRLADILDIAIIAAFLHLALLWLKQRASYTVIMTIGLVAWLYVFAYLLGMHLTLFLFQTGLTATLVALVLIFQEDIRRGFDCFATRGMVSRQRHLPVLAQPIEALVETMTTLADDKIGALVVIRGREPLERHLHGGVVVNGHISLPLLYSIFHPHSPGHDGAVVLEGSQVVKLGVHLPLSAHLEEVGRAGTRHTAALGLAERSDALVLVVSEERGTISVAEQGKLLAIDSAADLREHLERFYHEMWPTTVPTPYRWQWVRRHLGSKLAALCIAGLLWLLFGFHLETIQRTFMVPIVYQHLPSDWIIEEPKPVTARVTLSGWERMFDFDANTLAISVDMKNVIEGTQEVLITEANLKKPRDLAVTQIEPRRINLWAYRMRSLSVPVKVQFEGELPSPLRVVNVKAQPSTVRILLQPSDWLYIPELHTLPINLTNIKQTTTVRVPLLLPHRHSWLLA